MEERKPKQACKSKNCTTKGKKTAQTEFGAAEEMAVRKLTKRVGTKEEEQESNER